MGVQNDGTKRVGGWVGGWVNRVKWDRWVMGWCSRLGGREREGGREGRGREEGRKDGRERKEKRRKGGSKTKEARAGGRVYLGDTVHFDLSAALDELGDDHWVVRGHSRGLSWHEEMMVVV